MHLPRLGGDGSLGVCDGIAQIVEQPLGLGDEAPPGLGEPDAPADPLEKGYAHLLLESGDLARDGRLIRLEDLGRSPEVLHPGHLDAGAEQIGIDAVHASIPTETCC